MGMFDWLFGKKKIDEKSETIQNVTPKKTSSNTSKQGCNNLLEINNK